MVQSETIKISENVTREMVEHGDSSIFCIANSSTGTLQQALLPPLRLNGVL